MTDRVRSVGAGSIAYVPDRSHRHEGHHRIAVGDRMIFVNPDGRTTGRQRSDAATRALNASHERGASDQDAIEQLIGALVLAGATNLVLDGQPVFTSGGGTTVASLRLDVVDNAGSIDIELSHLHGAGE